MLVQASHVLVDTARTESFQGLAQLLPVLVFLLNQTTASPNATDVDVHDRLVTDTLASISSLSGARNYCAVVGRSGVLPRLVQLLRHRREAFQRSALCVLADVSCGPNEAVQVLMREHILAYALA